MRRRGYLALSESRLPFTRSGARPSISLIHSTKRPRLDTSQPGSHVLPRATSNFVSTVVAPSQKPVVFGHLGFRGVHVTGRPVAFRIFPVDALVGAILPPCVTGCPVSIQHLFGTITTSQTDYQYPHRCWCPVVVSIPFCIGSAELCYPQASPMARSCRVRRWLQLLCLLETSCMIELRCRSLKGRDMRCSQSLLQRRDSICLSSKP